MSPNHKGGRDETVSECFHVPVTSSHAFVRYDMVKMLHCVSTEGAC